MTAGSRTAVTVPGALVLALAVLLLGLLSTGPVAPQASGGEPRAECRWQYYKIIDRKNVSCDKAKEVLKAYVNDKPGLKGFRCNGPTNVKCRKGDEASFKADVDFQ
jgi:hypothetical protein